MTRGILFRSTERLNASLRTCLDVKQVTLYTNQISTFIAWLFQKLIGQPVNKLIVDK